jgi:capsular polysaccharide biosynthesis protein
MIPWSGAVPHAVELKGTAAVIVQSWSNAVHHWNMESFPRFELLRLAGFSPEKIDHFVVRELEPWHLEYTDRLGIPREKIRPMGQIFNVKADQLLVCSNVEQADWSVNPPDLEPEPWMCRLMRDLIPDPDPTQVPTEMIYISRANAGSRRVFNEGDLRKFLEDNNFKTIFFEDLSLDEKAKTMRSAKVVVAPIGAALTYVPFMRPGSKCLALYSDDGCGSTFRDICANAGVTHIHAIFSSMTCYFPSAFVPTADHLREQLVDIRHLCRVLERIGVNVGKVPVFKSLRNRQ